jgi:outer membrane lipoprotein SlyB
MTRATLAAALPVSSLLVGCAERGDTADRTALEQQALERDLDLVLEPDTTAEVVLVDLPAPEPEAREDLSPAQAPPARDPAPPPAQRAPRPPPPPVLAPAPTRPEGPRYVTRPVPAGSTFSVRINEELSTRTARVGQTFSATLIEPLHSADGTMVVPAGAMVRGRVTHVQASGNAGQRADLGVAFTSVSHDGETYPLHGTVVEAPHVRRVNRASRTETAAKVGGGAAVGAVLGRIIGRDTRSTVAGAVVGAAAGTAVAVGTADVDGVISPGATATLRLDSSIPVRTEAR